MIISIFLCPRVSPFSPRLNRETVSRWLNATKLRASQADGLGHTGKGRALETSNGDAPRDGEGLDCRDTGC